MWGDVSLTEAVAVGEARSRFNTVINTPYQTASAPGFQADKKQDFNEVFIEGGKSEEHPLPRFYTMGRIGTPNKLSGAMKARGKFRKLGEIDESDFSVPNLNYVGGELGIVPAQIGAPSDNVWGFYTTKDGKRFKLAVQFLSYFGWSTNLWVWTLVPGSQRGVRRNSLTWGMMLNWYDGKFYSVYGFYDGANKSWNVGGSLRYTDHDCGSKIAAIAPGKLICYTTVQRETPPETIHIDGDGTYMVNKDPDSEPKPFLSLSSDKGHTWSYINIDSIFSDFADSDYLGSITPAYSKIAQLVRFFPVTPTKTLMIAPFLKSNGLNSHGFEDDPQWEYRVYSIVGTIIAHISTMDIAYVDPDTCYFIDETDSVNRKGVLILNTVSNGVSPIHTPKFVISPDYGVTWSYHDKPWASGYAGFPSWVDEDTLIHPVYDGEHSLYQSLDNAATWEKVGTIRDDGDTPNPAGRYLPAFGYVRQFRRKDGTAAACTMGAEWISDGSVSYVPPT